MELTGFSETSTELNDLFDTEQDVITDTRRLPTMLKCRFVSRLYSVRRMFHYKQTAPCQFILKVEISLVFSKEMERIRFESLHYFWSLKDIEL
jgi:hypothetical protein